MHQAVCDGLIEALALILGELNGRVDFNHKIGHACDWVFHFFAGNAYARAFRGRLILAQILDGAKAGARAGRSQQQFGPVMPSPKPPLSAG